MDTMDTIGKSVKYTIGGKTYNADDVSRLHSGTYMPTDKVKTQSSINEEAADNVNIQNTQDLNHRLDNMPVNTVNRIQTGSVRMPDNNFSLFNAVESFHNRKVPIGITQVAGAAEAGLSKQQDLGAGSAGMAVRAAEAGEQALKMAQKATDGLEKIGKGVYRIGGVVAAVSRKTAFIKAGQFHPVSHTSLGGLQGGVKQHIIHAVTGIQTELKKKIQTAVSTGVRTGKDLAIAAVKTPFAAAMATGKAVLKYGPAAASGMLKNTEDYALQGAGHVITTTDIGIRTMVRGIKATPHVVKTAVNTGQKLYGTGKDAVKAAKYIKNNGLRAAWKKGRKKAAQKAAEAGKSLVNALINALKALGSKAVVPLIIIVTAVVAINGVTSAPVTTVASIFGSVFSTKDTDVTYDVHEYLEAAVPDFAAEFKQELADELEDCKKSYHIVRLRSGSGDILEPGIAGINSVIPVDEELINMLQPVYNAVLLMDYKLEPTESQSKELAKKLFYKLFTVETDVTTEQCGQDLKTGEGTVVTHDCGAVHALGNCPNPKKGKHKSYTCSQCCSKKCPGHGKYYCSEENCKGHKNYCPGCEFKKCSGYSYCAGHDVITYKLSVDGAYKIEVEYFLTPIGELEGKETRTDEEEEKLQELKDYHEIYLEMVMLAVADSNHGMPHGGGGESGGDESRSHLSVTEIETIIKDVNDPKAKTACRFALSKVGYPYSQDFRDSGNYYDCSSLAFYSWKSAGVDLSFGVYTPTAADECQKLDASGKGFDYTSVDVLKPGDLIFFSYDTNGRYRNITHVAIYIGHGNVAEAADEKKGVIYGKFNTGCIVRVGRP